MPFLPSSFSSSFSSFYPLGNGGAQRRFFHASFRRAVVFKSRDWVDIPRTDFFNYILGDISGHEDKPALTDGLTGRTLTYEELRNKSIRLGRSMMERGYRRGDVVAVISPNVVEYVLTSFGCAYAGIAVTHLNPLETSAVHRRQLFETNAKALFVFPFFARKAVEMAESMPLVRDVFLFGFPFTNNAVVDLYRRAITSRHVTTSYFSVLLRRDPTTRGSETPVLGQLPFQRPEIDLENDILALPFSSGTTGRPKAVVCTHASSVAYVDVMVQSPHVQKWRNEDEATGYETSSMALLPMFHIFGFGMMCVVFKLRGRNVTNLRFHPTLFLRTIEKYKIRRIPVVPPLLDFLARHPAAAKADLSHVVLVFCGAAPLDKASADRLASKYPGVKVEQGYGMTEGAVSGTLDDDVPYCSAGRLLPNAEAKIVDLTSGEEMDHNGVGELVIRSPSVMKGYWMDAAATEDAFHVDADGKRWLKTGDVGFFDEFAVLRLVDRIKEMIKFKGHQVSPAEIESEIRCISGVKDAAVVGVADPKAGEVPFAFVVKEKDSAVTEQGVKDHIRSQMVSYNELRGGVVFIDETPKSITGKVNRKQLKQMALAAGKD